MFRRHSPELKALNAARRHRDHLEARRREIIARRCPKGKPLWGFGFVRHVTTNCLLAGIQVDRLTVVHAATLKKGK